MNKPLISKAFNPDNFRHQGHLLVELLGDYLESALQSSKPVNRWRDPEDQLTFWQNDYKEGDRELGRFFKNLIDSSLHMHNPKNMGHQVAIPAPEAALAGLLTELLNNGTVVYEIGAPAVVLERVVCKQLAQEMGFDPGKADGFMTSGASLANLTALMAIRNIKAGEDVWNKGNNKQYALMVSEEAHYCIDKSLRIMGLGEAGTIRIPVDEHYKVRVEMLESAYRAARDRGVEILGVIGCSCSTSTGTYEELEPLADFAQAHNLWFHVDAAHGGPAIFSKKHRHRLKGIERADSVVMDFHKMMMTPALSTAIIFREAKHSYRSFSQKAQYLWEEQEKKSWFNLGQRSFECTKLMMSVKIYTLLRQYGTALFEEYIDYTYDLAQSFAGMLKQESDLELALQPETNVVCFRYNPGKLSSTSLSKLNSLIRKKLIEDGEFYIVQTQLKDDIWLRVTLMNPFTTTVELRALLEKIKQLGRQLVSEQ